VLWFILTYYIRDFILFVLFLRDYITIYHGDLLPNPHLSLILYWTVVWPVKVDGNEPLLY